MELSTDSLSLLKIHADTPICPPELTFKYLPVSP